MRPKDLPDPHDYSHPANTAPIQPVQAPSRANWEVRHQNVSKRVSVPWATKEDNTEDYILTDRPLELIDRSSKYKLTAMLIKQLKQHPDRDVRVLDVGGGVASLAMRGMLKHPMFRNRIRATNIDLFAASLSSEQLIAENIDPNRLRIIRDDILTWNPDSHEAEHGSEGFDLILGWESINNMPGNKLYPVIEKCAALLAPGGELIVRDDRIAGRSGINPWMIVPLPSFPGFPTNAMQKIANEHDVMIVPSFCEEELDGRLFLFGGGAGLLLMRKTDPKNPMVSPKDYDTAFPEIHEAITQHERWWEKKFDKK